MKTCEAALAAAVFAAVLTGAVIDADADALSGKLIRLHVIAASDSQDDQTVKLKVRDAVIAELSPSLEGVSDRADAERIITENLTRIENAARRTLISNGKTEAVTVTLSRESYPTREYETFSLPAGEYSSLRVTIGEGEGKNWWCVVFPPVCESESVEDIPAAAIGLTDDEIALITENGDGYVVKFRLMELIARIKEFF